MSIIVVRHPSECDIVETVCFSKILDEFLFYEIDEPPLCCAVGKRHRLAERKMLDIEELNGGKFICIAEGCSEQTDALVERLRSRLGKIHFKMVPLYTESVFSMCELQDFVLITPKCWSEVHNQLITIPVNWNHKIPYGYVFPKIQAMQFIPLSRLWRTLKWSTAGNANDEPVSCHLNG